MSDQNRKWYEELGDLARYIEQTMHGFQNLQQPIEAASHQLPQATAHLSDLPKMSEEATHNVMGQTEAIQDNHGRLLAALNGVLASLSHAGIGGQLLDDLEAMRQLLNDDEKRLIEIFTALSFQDLLAQRVNKLVTVLTDVEHKLLELLVIFESQHSNGQQGDQDKTGDMLKRLETSKTTTLKQNLVDTGGRAPGHGSPDGLERRRPRRSHAAHDRDLSGRIGQIESQCQYRDHDPADHAHHGQSGRRECQHRRRADHPRQ